MQSDGRPTIFVDENLGEIVAKVLTQRFSQVVFKTATVMNTRGMNDSPLFHHLAENKVDAILTHDRHQLFNQDERVALEASGLSWIGVCDVHNQHQYPTKYAAKAAKTAAIMASIPEIVRLWPPQQFYCLVPLQKVTPVSKLDMQPLSDKLHLQE